MRSVPRSAAVLVVAGALLLAGCGAETPQPAAGADDTSTTRTDPTDPAEPGASADSPVPDTLRFTGTTVGGESFDAASLAGEPVLLWFWAPWCPTCRGQVPQVEGLAAQHDGELAVVGVGSLDSEQAIADFAGDVEGVTHLVDTEGELWQRFEVAEQSSFVLLDAEGRVVLRTGYGGTDDLADEVAGVLG